MRKIESSSAWIGPTRLATAGSKVDCIPSSPVFERARSAAVPTLFRFLVVLAILAGLVYGGMLALIAFVHVQPREITQTVPASKFAK
jgi:hypothetical protein